jgi:dipeptidyl aminopeptidase/acylaminoacyl peptidase
MPVAIRYSLSGKGKHRLNEFVRYPEGSHAMPRTGYPAHRCDDLERVVGWFTRHLGAGAG